MAGEKIACTSFHLIQTNTIMKASIKVFFFIYIYTYIFVYIYVYTHTYIYIWICKYRVYIFGGLNIITDGYHLSKIPIFIWHLLQSKKKVSFRVKPCLVLVSQPFRHQFFYIFSLCILIILYSWLTSLQLFVFWNLEAIYSMLCNHLLIMPTIDKAFFFPFTFIFENASINETTYWH